MDIESIIGLVAGIFGIATGVVWLVGETKNKMKSASAGHLFKELTNRELSDARRKDILKRLNKTSIIAGRITNGYISKFQLNSRGKEKLFLDLCVQNNIEPTGDLCRKLLNVNAPALQKRYEENKAQIIRNNLENIKPVINVKQTVYFSQHLTAYKCWNNIKQALDANGVAYGLLPNTKDIWVRDFMPAYVNGKYVAYKYNPDYLQDNREYITDDISDVFNFSDDSVVETGLILDGGNIITCGNKVIMTEKIFVENPGYTREQLIQKIEMDFSAKLIIIPWDREEIYGHADGMVRCVSADHVLINNYKDIDPELYDRLLEALSPHFSKISELEYGKAARSQSWAHLNYLQVGDLIFVPQLRISSDQLAIGRLSEVFAGSTIVPVEVNSIVRKGGALNCVSWNHFEI